MNASSGNVYNPSQNCEPIVSYLSKTKKKEKSMGLHRNFMEKIDSDEGKVVNLPKKKKKVTKHHGL